MPTPTYDLLDSTTLSSSASSVTFSSISQDYRDLVLVVEMGHDGGSFQEALFRFNGDTGSNYSYVYMFGNGSVSQSSSASSVNKMFLANPNVGSGHTILSVVSVLDYSATDKHKTALARGNNTSAGTSGSANRWANTSAITSITVFFDAQNIVSGSTFYLYGVAS